MQPYRPCGKIPSKSLHNYRMRLWNNFHTVHNNDQCNDHYNENYNRHNFFLLYLYLFYYKFDTTDCQNFCFFSRFNDLIIITGTHRPLLSMNNCHPGLIHITDALGNPYIFPNQAIRVCSLHFGIYIFTRPRSCRSKQKNGYH